VDNDHHEITAFDPHDHRTITLRIAGPAALLVAKIIKIGERRTDPRRLMPKDGLDVLRLLQVIDMPAVATQLRVLAADPMAGPVTRLALDILRNDGCQADGLIATLAAKAIPAIDWDTTTQSMASLAIELLASTAGRAIVTQRPV